MEPLDNLLRIEDRQQAESLLQEWGRLIRRERELEAARDEEIAIAKRKHAERLTIERQGERTTIPERIELLKASVEAWAIQHRDLLLTSKAKSVELTHGKLAWRAVPQRVIEQDGAAANELRESLLGTWTEAAMASLRDQTIPRLRIVGVDQIVKLTVAWDRTAIAKVVDRCQLKPADLGQVGFTLSEPGESLSITLTPRN